MCNTVWEIIEQRQEQKQQNEQTMNKVNDKRKNYLPVCESLEIQHWKLHASIDGLHICYNIQKHFMQLHACIPTKHNTR